jgi:hypothetical protein
MADGENIGIWKHFCHYVQHAFATALAKIPVVDNGNARVGFVLWRRQEGVALFRYVADVAPFLAIRWFH